MEYQNEHSLFDMQYDEQLKQQMKSAASMAGISAILSLVGSVLSFINYFVMQSRIRSTFSAEGFGGIQYRDTSSGGNLFSAVLSLVLAIFMFYFLSQYARLSKAGLEGGDTFQIGDGLAKLSTYFKIIGVVLIIALVFMFLAILIALAAGI